MKSSIVTLLLALAVVSPSMASDFKEDIVAIEKSSWKAVARHDAKAYGDTMTDDAISDSLKRQRHDGKTGGLGRHQQRRSTVKSFDIADTKVRQLSPDIAILTYNLSQDVTCDGKSRPRSILDGSLRAAGRQVALDHIGQKQTQTPLPLRKRTSGRILMTGVPWSTWRVRPQPPRA